MMTGWKPFDPLVAYAIAANILWSGGRLMWHSAKGLLDYSEAIERALEGDSECEDILQLVASCRGAR
jgi:divalent metal cation (Fe/Co/Zn/Cd) transporter